jgi:hypothetical protein
MIEIRERQATGSGRVSGGALCELRDLCVEWIEIEIELPIPTGVQPSPSLGPIGSRRSRKKKALR